jgi:prophage regulatory protein
MNSDPNELLTSAAIPNEPRSLEPRKMLTEAEVLALVPFKRATLYNRIRDGRFPRAIHISSNRVCWFADDIARWQNALADSNPYYNPQRPRGKGRRPAVKHNDHDLAR